MEIVPSLIQTFRPDGLPASAKFGESMAMSLDQSVYLVGAPGESSNVGAAYVLRLVNGAYVQTKLTATGGSGSPQFGQSVALSGDGTTAAIGAWEDAGIGAVYIFDYGGSSWSQTIRLTATGRQGTFGNFGFALDLNLDGTVLIVGDFIDGASDDRGSVYFFTKSGGSWSQTIRIPYGTSSQSWLGFSVAIDAAGTTAIAGASLANGQVGEAYIYSNGSGTWTQVGSALTPTGNNGNGRFGNAVALNAAGNRAIVCGYFDFVNSFSKGAAYVFAEQNGTWSQLGKLVGTGLTPNTNTYFGSWASLNAVGDLALIGAFRDDTGEGAAFVFEGAIDANMTQVGSLISPPSTNGEFGNSLTLSSTGTSALVGAHFEDSNVGAVYSYRMMEFPLKYYQKVTPSSVTTDARFGESCAMDANGNRLIVGGWYDNGGEGSVFFYEKQNGVWTETQKVTIGDGEFGSSLDLSADGTTAIIGAPEIDSSDGAAYIYQESGGTWTQINKLSPPTPGQGNRFGNAVALGLNGTRAIVGASDEDTNDGAFYIFENLANTWTQINRFTPVTGSGQRLGFAVDMSEDGTTAIAGTLSGQYVDVYTNGGGTWSYATTINGSGLSQFGRNLTIDGGGTTILMGAFGANTNGQAFIYTGANASWSLAKTLDPVGAVGSSRFGVSCAIDSTGTTVGVGAIFDDSSRGAAYAFTSSGNWSILGSKLTAPAADSSRFFGISVSLDGTGSTMAVGTTSNTTLDGSVYVFAYPQTTVTPGFLALSSDINVAAGVGISAWMNGSNVTPIPNLSLTIGGAATQSQILTNGYGWVSTQANTSRSVIVNDANFSFTSPPKYTTAFIAKTNDSAHGSTTLRLLDNEGDAFAYPATISVNGNWTIATSANGITCTSKNVVQSLPYLFLTNDISETVVNAITVEGATTIQGVQAFSSSSATQPENCLDGSTQICLSNGSFVRIDSLRCGSMIRTVTPEGLIQTTKVDIIRTRLPGLHDALEITYKGTTFVSSPKHISLFEGGDLPSHVSCCRCGSRGNDYGRHPSCLRCSQVKVKGYRPMLGCDIAGCKDIKVQKVTHKGHWYHIILPPPMSHAFILGNGILSEGFRHPLGSKKKRDMAWKLVQ